MKKIVSRLALALLLSCGFLSVAQAYVVQPGDSLAKIAVRTKMSLQHLININPQIRQPARILPGDFVATNDKGAVLGVAANSQPVAGFNYYLAGSGVTGSNSSFTLQSLTIPQTGYLLQDSDFSATFYVTLEPGNSKKQEIAACTTVVQNANGTATLSSCSRGLLPFSPYTASTTYSFAHAGGTTVIFSDPPQLFNEYGAKANNETITGQWGFTQLPTSTTSTPTDPQQLVTLYQLQQATSTGGINAATTVKGVVQLGTLTNIGNGTVTGTTGAFLVPYIADLAGTGGTAYVIPHADFRGKLDNSFGGVSTSLATLNSSTLVVENPANATSTPTASKIPFADASSTVNTWVNYGALFGDGSDGNVTVSVSTTLTRDMYYNNLTISNSSTITTNGYRIYIRGTLSGANASSTIAWNGGNASGLTAGTGGVQTSYGAGTVGGTGANGAFTGGDSGPVSNSFGSRGGIGGSDNNGHAGGGTGTISTSTPPRAFSLAHYLFDPATSTILKVGQGGSGGGGGGASAVSVGGGGGGGGGVVVVFANALAGTLTVQAIGGDGANASGAQAGGGAGGGGGHVSLYYHTTTATLNVSVRTGNGGTGIGGGAAGGSGVGGTFVVSQL